MKLTLKELNLLHVEHEFHHALTSVDKNGDEWEFAVAVEEFSDVRPYPEVALWIYPLYDLTEFGLEVRFRQLKNTLFQVVMMYNHEEPLASGKGIVERAIEWWSEYMKSDIISSSNKDEYKTDKKDQRGKDSDRV